MAPLIGRVIRTKTAKTAMVQVARKLIHPLYGKDFVKRTKYMVHDETEKCNVGDIVQIAHVAVLQPCTVSGQRRAVPSRVRARR